MKNENMAHENMLIERMREREKTNSKRYYNISTSPVRSNFFSKRGDVVLGRTKRYFKISLTPVRFGFYTLGRDDEVVRKGRNGGPDRGQDWELPWDNEKP